MLRASHLYRVPCKLSLNQHKNARHSRRNTPTSRPLLLESLEERLVLSTAPVVNQLVLLNDTGSSASDNITMDPTVTGLATHDGSNTFLRVEFDSNGDGSVDGSAYTGPTGEFWYLPAGLETGTYTVQARARESVYGQSESVAGSWASFTFTLVDDPSNAAPEVTELVLREDTGVSSTDGVTGDPRLRGTVTNDNDGFVKVQFDTNGDGKPDAEEYADLAGNFSYSPAGLSAGPATIGARAAEWSADRFADVQGPWVSITFTLDPSENLPPVLTDIHLPYDTGIDSDDLITSDASLSGFVTNDGSTADVAIEFDVDGDDVVDGSTMATSTGSYSWTGSGLSDGEITIRTRAREWIPGQTPVVSPWTALTFTLDASQDIAPIVASLSLFNDTGESNIDGITRDARVAGSATDDGRLAGLVVQFDHDGDGNPDGSAGTDANGQFRYTPGWLSEGPVTILARAGQTGSGGAVVNLGEWVALSFTLEGQFGTNPPTLSSMNLLRDTGTSSTDRITIDPRIRGSVVHDQGVIGLRVNRLDHDRPRRHRNSRQRRVWRPDHG